MNISWLLTYQGDYWFTCLQNLEIIATFLDLNNNS